MVNVTVLCIYELTARENRGKKTLAQQQFDSWALANVCIYAYVVCYVNCDVLYVEDEAKLHRAG